jgi:hypothetical protein
LLAIALLSRSAPRAEDRKALIGEWLPEDGSGRLVLFREDGMFVGLSVTPHVGMPQTFQRAHIDDDARPVRNYGAR